MVPSIFKEVFGDNTPSVSLFCEYIKDKSPEEQQRYYEIFYRLGLEDWNLLSKRNRKFLISLVRHDWQRCLNFLLANTFLGALRFKLKHAWVAWKLIKLTEGRPGTERRSTRHLTFSYLLAFEVEPHPKINTWRIKEIHEPLTADEIWDLLGKVLIGDSK